LISAKIIQHQHSINSIILLLRHQTMHKRHSIHAFGQKLTVVNYAHYLIQFNLQQEHALAKQMTEH